MFTSGETQVESKQIRKSQNKKEKKNRVVCRLPLPLLKENTLSTILLADFPLGFPGTAISRLYTLQCADSVWLQARALSLQARLVLLTTRLCFRSSDWPNSDHVATPDQGPLPR